MKKIIPVIALLGIGLIAGGCSNDNSHTINIDKEIKSFANTVNEYANLNEVNAKPIFNKYKLLLSTTDNTANGVLQNNTTQFEDKSNINNTDGDVNYDNEIMPIENDESHTGNIINSNEIDIIKEDETNQTTDTNTDNNTTTEQIIDIDNISTLYSLTEDINSYTEQYLTLKTNISSAIKETENLISKVKSGEIKLTAEQRMMISNQSKQLRQLSKDLSRSTSLLNLELVDLNELMRSNVDTDVLTLKYLAVLNNLTDGNNMLENGLSSLMLINHMFNANGEKTISNGKLIYGFKKKDEPAEIKEFEIKDGEIKETTIDNNNNEMPKTTEANEEKLTDNNKLQTNTDTYGNNYKNIDSFFNTALLDNQFMYGGNGFGMNGFNGTYNPYVYNNMTNQNNENTAQNNNINNQNKTTNKDKKKFTKNIDTYKSNGKTTLSTKFKHFKDNLKRNKQKIKKPSFKYEEESNM